MPTSEYVKMGEFTFCFGEDGFYVAVSRLLYLWTHQASSYSFPFCKQIQFPEYKTLRCHGDKEFLYAN
jgi:hypothetical protein